jgi:PST family polysaccharide transporter
VQLRQRFVRGVAWTTVSNIGQQVINLGVVVVLARLLDQQAFGLVALAMAVIAIFEVFRESGFNDSLIQRAELRQAHLNTIFTVTLAIGVAITVTLALTAGLVADAFGEPELADVLWALSVVPTLASLSATKDALLRREMRFKLITFINFAVTLSTAAVAVTLALLSFGVWALVAKAILAPLVLVLAYRVCRVTEARIGFDRQAFGEVSSVSFYVLGSNLLNIVSRRADDLIIGGFLGTTALGYYTIAYNLLLSLTRVLIRTINGVTLPLFSKLQGDRARLGGAFRRIVTTASLVTLPAFAFFSVSGPEIITFLYGDDWAKSGELIRVLALVGMAHSLTFFQASLLLGAGKAGWRLGLTLATAVLNAAGFLIGVQYGLMGVAWAALIVIGLIVPVGMVLVARVVELDARAFTQNMLRTAAGVLTMVAAVLVFRSWAVGRLPDFALIAASGGIAAGVYSGFLLLLAPRNLQDVYATFLAGKLGKPTRG